MPTMSEIYENFSVQYDELVTREDYEGNLNRFLHEKYDFYNKTIVEYGTGTGRVSALYLEKAAHALCLDRSDHMLLKAKDNLKEYKNKISYELCDNQALPLIKDTVDFVIEGWSFGHTVIDNFNQLEKTVNQLVSNCASILNDDGAMIFIETLGSNVNAPCAPTAELNAFYTELETAHGFKKTILKTDYKFQNYEEAYRVFSFFFGPAMAENIKANKLAIIPEYTGVWIRGKQQKADYVLQDKQ